MSSICSMRTPRPAAVRSGRRVGKIADSCLGLTQAWPAILPTAWTGRRCAGGNGQVAPSSRRNAQPTTLPRLRRSLVAELRNQVGRDGPHFVGRRQAGTLVHVDDDSGPVALPALDRNDPFQAMADAAALLDQLLAGSDGKREAIL